MRSTQIMKEARQLAWPWTLVMLPGLAVLTAPGIVEAGRLGTVQGLPEWIMPIGTFFGTSLLAAMPLGAEFQYRTLAMRFAQPIDRNRLWRQKFLFTLAAVIPPALIYCLALALRFGQPFAVMASAWIVATIAGSIPFTLLARSTMGGMVLNIASGAGVTVGWVYYEKHGTIPTPWLVAMGFAVSVYAAVMIWLGRRMMLRFQAADGMQAGEAFVPGARLVPKAVADWFRCRPTQRVMNLLRREFRLLRSLWPLVVFYLVAWIFLVAFNQLPSDKPDSLHVSFVLTAILGLLIAVLAGTLSLGEEKTWGTHEWHMTLPVSIPLQWAIKLFFALFTSLVCAALVPMLVLVANGWLGGPGRAFLSGNTPVVWIGEALVITLAAFWCACIVKSTVQATLWVFPFCFAVMFAANSGSSIMQFFRRPMQMLVSGIVAHLNPMTMDRVSWWDFRRGWKVDPSLYLVAALLLSIGLIQSMRSFRAQVSSNRLRLVRNAVPLLIVAFVCSLGTQLYFRVMFESWNQQDTILRETDQAIAAVQAANGAPSLHSQRRLSLEELSKATSLSSPTKRWLGDASIFVGPAPVQAGDVRGPWFQGRRMISVPKTRLANSVPYSAVIRKKDGSGCSLLFQIQQSGRYLPFGPYGFVNAICN